MLLLRQRLQIVIILSGDRTMKLTKTLRATALAAGLATVLGLALTPTPAAAATATATGNTVFKVILQPVVILDYYKEIDLTIPSAALASLTGGASNSANVSAITAAVSGGNLSASAALSTSGNAINAVNLDITNAYSVRSITTNSGNTTVSVAFAATGGGTSGTATLTGVSATGSTIGLSNPGTSLVGFTGSGLGAAQANYGDVSMQLDLTNAKNADTYAGATIVITATST